MPRSGPNLLSDPIGPTVIRLALPTLFGLAAIILFGVVDTYWVAQLGDAPLAAMGYVFPVTAVIISVSIGVGIGTTSAISRTLGNGDRTRVGPLTTHALLLAFVSVALVAGLGLLTMDVVFARMGADPQTLKLIKQYMTPWYWGVCFLVVPMVGNSAIRATGDTRSPSLIMALSGFLNALLTPLMMFGWGPVPALGLPGAAYATVLSWTLTFAASITLLHHRERALSLQYLKVPSEVWRSWKAILHVGLPAAAANLLFPFADGVLTAMIAKDHGNDAVAGFGVATRVEQVALIGVFALSTAVSPLVGQNFGARRWDRVRATAKFVLWGALVWGGGIAVILLVLGWPLARVFSQSDAIAEVLHSYWQLVPLSYGLLGTAVLANTTFNALQAPGRSTLLTVIRLFALLLPFSALGLLWGELQGMFLGMALALATGGLLAGTWVLRWIATQDKAHHQAEQRAADAAATAQ